jgi:endogenous inhibitor of DNA gyrase (YacG/DUF329 family)
MTEETKSAKAGEAQSAEILPLRAPRRCANCSKETVRAFYPFCSKRCKDVDLHRWLSGAYAIPVVERDAGNNDDDA